MLAHAAVLGNQLDRAAAVVDDGKPILTERANKIRQRGFSFGGRNFHVDLMLRRDLDNARAIGRITKRCRPHRDDLRQSVLDARRLELPERRIDLGELGVAHSSIPRDVVADAERLLVHADWRVAPAIEGRDDTAERVAAHVDGARSVRLCRPCGRGDDHEEKRAGRRERDPLTCQPCTFVPPRDRSSHPG